MKRIAATVHPLCRAASVRAVVPLALAGLLGALTLGVAAPRASAGTPHWRSVVLVNADGTSYNELTLLSGPFRTAGPVTMAWKVAAAM
jgi:hypothetical protein